MEQDCHRIIKSDYVLENLKDLLLLVERKAFRVIDIIVNVDSTSMSTLINECTGWEAVKGY